MNEVKQSLATFDPISIEAPEVAGESSDGSRSRPPILMAETFIGTLAHDLREPVAAFNAGLRILKRIPCGPQHIQVVGLMQRSAVRMEEMIGTLLDFTRIRLGGQLRLNLRRGFEVETVLRQVVDEFRLAWTGKEISCHLSLCNAVMCDAQRIAQIASNLLRNAIVHGDGGPIEFSARSDANGFELFVTNTGVPIDKHRVAGLLRNFSCANETTDPGDLWLGLGLSIASRIAAAHHGILSVTSTVTSTRFTFQMSSDLNRCS
jgi:signal transduction histidine kinase